MEVSSFVSMRCYWGTVDTLKNKTPDYILGHNVKCIILYTILSVDCNGLAAPTNGSLSSTNVTHGNIMTVSCDTGYKLQGNYTLICFSGSLLEQIGTCVSGTLHVCHVYSTLPSVCSSLKIYS